VNVRTGAQKEKSKRFEWVDDFLAGRWKDSPEEFKRMVILARYDWGVAWEDSFGQRVCPAMIKIRDLAHGMGARLAVVMFPASPQVYARFDDPFLFIPQKKFGEFAMKNDIPFLDLLPGLRAKGSEKMYPDQCHLNRKGNLEAANLIFPFLSAQLR
jgi:hypothetical protein